MNPFQRRGGHCVKSGFVGTLFGVSRATLVIAIVPLCCLWLRHSAIYGIKARRLSAKFVCLKKRIVYVGYRNMALDGVDTTMSVHIYTHNVTERY